ncbi:MAG TPA: hypothetical protein VHD14_02715 [Pseudolabrys sp.]|nr:hypothetical protein [Pseudolabrys sp.]
MAVPEAYLSAKLMGNLGCPVDVICAEPFRARFGSDTSLDDYVAKRFANVMRLSPPAHLRLVPLEALGPVASRPDFMRFMNKTALRAAERLDLTSYAAVVSWSQWHSVHLVGLALKERHPRLRWLAHFSDPWSTNPFFKAGAVTRAANLRLERKVLHAADGLLFTTEETKAEMAGDSQFAAKATVLPHCFDPALYPDAASQVSDEKLRLRYLGAFYGSRTPEPLFRGLVELLGRRPELAKKLQIELIGRTKPAMLDGEARRKLPAPLIKLVAPVDYRTSLALMRQADLLLVIDAPSQASPFLPSKLVDYIGARRPVLGITPPGAAARVINELGGWVADPGDASAVAGKLEQAIDYLLRKRQGDWGRNDVAAQYHAETVGAATARLLQ